MVGPSREVKRKKDEHWDLLESFVRVGSRWVTLIGERWRYDKGKILEYWRVEKADSVIVLPLQRKHITLSLKVQLSSSIEPRRQPPG